MSLTIEKNEDSQRQLTLKIEVDEERVQQAMRRKARELGRELHIPGFRRGKASYDVIARRIGEPVLRAEAVDDLIQPIYEEALEEAEVEPYAQASLEDIEADPLTVTFTIPLAPTVVLGDYRERRQEIEEVSISEEAVEEALQQVQTRHQVLEVADRPAELGDVVTIAGKGTLTAVEVEEAEADADADDDAAGATAAAEETIFDEEQIQLLLDSEVLFPHTPFVDNIVGLEVGDERSFTFSFPEDYELEPAFAGREAAFELTVLEIQNRDLPEIDDELAKLEGEYETLDELRVAITDELTAQAVETKKEATIEELTDYLVEDAEIVFPPAAVELQLDDMVAEFKEQLTRSGWQVQDYLQLQGLTEESLRDDFRENAEKQLNRQLALRQFILDELLRVEAEDVDGLIETRIARFDNEGLRDSMRDYYRSGRGFEMISSEVLRDKVYDRATAIFTDNAPDLEELAALQAAEEADEEE